jgi:hypothetical protein
MSKPIYIKVGGNGPFDPAPGDTDILIPSLKGLEFYIEAGNGGPLLYSLYSPLSNGGARFTDSLVDEAEYWIHISGISYANDTTGSYTNGFDYNKVMSALVGRIGWMQTPDSPTLDNTNLISRSGRRFNDGSFHAMVTLNNIKAIMEQKNASDADFNAFLLASDRATILRCLNGVFNDVEYISQTLLYNRSGYGNNDHTISNEGKFVGIQIKLPPVVDMAVQIDSIALYFDSVKTFNIYVYNDVKLAPIYTKSVTTVANSQTVVDLDDFVLNYVGGSNHGGVFYIGYYQDDLDDTKAIRETNVCFMANAPYAALTIESPATGSNFNRNSVGYNLNTNGLNPHISVFRDHTWQIIKKPSLFDNVRGLQMAAQVIETMLVSTRSNGTERALKDGGDKLMLSMELTGTAPISEGTYTTGLRKQIEQELDRLEDAFCKDSKPMVVNYAECN